jgi:hypothetical protein
LLTLAGKSLKIAPEPQFQGDEMAWEFLYSVRREFQGDSHWGEMYMKTTAKRWEWLCYTYELPWKANAAGKSINSLSRVEMGVYELSIRTDGPARNFGGKGWRLELLKTGHRGYVQIHRASPSMFIEGCILPVHFNTFQGSTIQKGDAIIRTQSLALMDKMQVRLTNLQNSSSTTGRPTLTIAEKLPPGLITNRSHAHA